MNTLQKSAAALLVLGAALVSSCNSTLDDGTTTTTTNQSATGYWTGTDSVSGLAVTAFINSGGNAAFIRSDGAFFTGPVQVSGSTLAATVNGYAAFPATFTDGSVYGIGTLNGSVTTGTTLTATLSFTTNGGTAVTGSWSLSYETISTNTSSTATVAGNYTDTSTSQVLSITSSGAMTEQNASGTTFSGCVLNGTISTSDTSTNVYEVSYTLASCTGSALVLNSIQFTGLASLNTAQSPAQLTIVVSGTASSGIGYGIVSTLNSD